MQTKIEQVLPSSDEVKVLFRLLDEHNMSFCPPEICHLTQPEEMERIDSILFGVFCDNSLVGMGGLKLYDDYAEVTRMYIKETFRGKGLAFRLMERLQKAAEERSYKLLRLETSTKFEAAYRFYLRCGFELCEPFGEYVNKAHNTYMKKDIAFLHNSC